MDRPGTWAQKIISGNTSQNQDYSYEKVLQDLTPNSLWITLFNSKTKQPLAQFCPEKDLFILHKSYR